MDKKILVLGNSHSNDAMQQLWQVLKAYHPDEDFVIGYMYYSGCAVHQHVKFYNEKSAVYRYSRNITGDWEHFQKVTLEVGLEDQAWDIVYIHGTRYGHAFPKCNEADRRTLADIIAKHTKPGYKLGIHLSWANPDEEALYGDDWPVRAPPPGYKDRLLAKYGKLDQRNQYRIIMDETNKYLKTDDTYVSKVVTGAAIMYGLLELKTPQTDIYRDYTHLNDFGRLIAAHAFYVQLTKTPITEIKIDVIPQSLRWPYYRQFGDMAVTPEMKELAMKCANFSLENPWYIPEAE